MKFIANIERKKMAAAFVTFAGLEKTYLFKFTGLTLISRSHSQQRTWI